MKKKEIHIENTQDYSNLSKEELLGVVKSLNIKNIELKAQNDWFHEQLKDSIRHRFGQSSEKIPTEQLNFFNEAEAASDEKIKEPQMKDITYRRRKKQKGKRENDLSSLPEVPVINRLDESECNCPNCSGKLEEFGKEERHLLEYIPASFKHIREITMKYICRDCEKNDETTIIRANAPKPLISGSIATPSLVAGIINGKYVNAMPLYRQEKEFKRNGIFINRQNMANWVIICAERYLKSIYERMRTSLLSREILAADETTTQVLKEPGRKATTKSFMWLYRTVGEQKPVVIFDYQQTRQQEHPRNFLGDFKGYLHCDGYQCYHGLSEDIVIVGCHAHSRRRFESAWKMIPENARKDSQAHIGLGFCNKLFKIEREIKDLSLDEIQKTRQERSKPVLEEFYAWLQETKPLVPEKSKIGDAISYTLNQWKYLVNYLLDPRLELSNNGTERCVKSYIIPRKNFLFHDTMKGASSSATVFSIVETAKANNLRPYEYIKFLLENISKVDFENNPDEIDNLLPWSPSIPEYCISMENKFD